MYRNALVSSLIAVSLVAGPQLLSQQNPFKISRGKVSAVQVDYAFAGNVTGTGQRIISGDRMLDHQTTTGKFFGKTSTNDTWMLVTPDSVYSADLVKKTGTPLVTFIHPGGHEFVPAAPAVIARFFKEHGRE